MCRREHGLTWAEFEDLTLAQLEALEDRRAIEIRHARFNAALITSAIFNANRAQDSDALSPFALVPGLEPDPVEEAIEKKRQSVKRAMLLAMTRIPTGTKAACEMKEKMIARAKASGFDDAEEIFREAFPNG